MMVLHAVVFVLIVALFLVLVLQISELVLLCETRPCHARRHNESEGHSNFSSTIYSTVSLFCVWNITTVEINSGVHLLKS